MAYDDDYDDAEDTMRMRPISLPDPNLPGSNNRAVGQASAAAARQNAATAAGTQAGAPGAADDETRVITLPGQTLPSQQGGRTGRTARSGADSGQLRGLESGDFQEGDEAGEDAEYGLTDEQLAAKKKAKAKKVRLITIVTIVVIAILAVGGVAGWLIWRHMATTAALYSCQNASASLQQNIKDFNSEKNSSATQTALTATSSEVVNGSLISGLHNAVATDVPKTLSCSTSLDMDRLGQNASTMTAQAATIAKATSTIKTDVKAISASRNAKQVSDARESLTQLISSAQQTASDQVNNVDDSSTISTLQSAISSAQRLLAQQSATLTQLNQASQTISTAVAGVNASVQAKQEDAVKQKEQEEAEEKAKQEAQDKSGSDNSDSNSSDSQSNSDNNGQNSQNGQNQQNSNGGNNNRAATEPSPVSPVQSARDPRLHGRHRVSPSRPGQGSPQGSPRGRVSPVLALPGLSHLMCLIWSVSPGLGVARSLTLILSPSAPDAPRGSAGA